MPFKTEPDRWEAVHEKIIGLGESSIRKSYYPELRKRLRELERFRHIIDHASDFVLFFDAATYAITDVNLTMSSHLGYGREALIGRPAMEIVPGLSCEVPESGAAAGAACQFPRTMRYRCLREDGASVPVEASVQVIHTDEGPVGLMIARDITDSTRMEEMLLQAQKLEAIGTLAGGIAHDFNNILFPIIGYCELSLQGVPRGDPNRAHIEKILRAAERARKLVRQILTFSRPDKDRKRPMKVQSVISEALKLLRPTLPATIEIRKEIDPDCGPILADPTQIHQVFVNLCTNAYQAMRAGGVLMISLDEIGIDAGPSAASQSLLPGRYVRLGVTDSGHGMDHATLSRIFEPYFTTKAKGEGTGLGLSVLHGIVVTNGGEIQVASTPGKGTRFVVYFPRVEDTVTVSAATPDKDLPGGTEHILLVEDDEMLIQMEEQMLLRLGYRVTAFTDSVAALDHLRENPAGADLVLTDMTMPKLDGAEFAAKCLALRRDLPVVLCTGYSEHMDADRAAEMGISAFIGKPVKMRDLAEALRSVLRGHTGD